MLAVISVLVVEVSASSLVDIADPESVPPVCLIEVTVIVDPSHQHRSISNFLYDHHFRCYIVSVPGSDKSDVVALSVEFS